MTNLNLLKVLLIFAFPLLFFSCSEKEEIVSNQNENVTPEYVCPCGSWCFQNNTDCDAEIHFKYSGCTPNEHIEYIPHGYGPGCLVPPCLTGDCGARCPTHFEFGGFSFTKEGYSYTVDLGSTSCCPAGNTYLKWDHTLGRFIFCCGMGC